MTEQRFEYVVRWRREGWTTTQWKDRHFQDVKVAERFAERVRSKQYARERYLAPASVRIERREVGAWERVAESASASVPDMRATGRTARRV